ncbi:tetratricopeptide repeat protein [Pontibacter cellulosilyticus]|uniref:Tetratricopeptide repeat protein n=1 Tax=Pontibacter cellulosilyticus TaxID=1720253 RepID=A0A923N428_9BACT|nr:tetratricopeptide repeat protein [Pontibacter cellulosilyticus]MBC5991332.1 tetratricopeptide repeat protein [Pontibacter cellulosilyticus]
MKKLLLIISAFYMLGCDGSYKDANSVSWIDRSSEFQSFINDEEYQKAFQIAGEQVKIAEDVFPNSRRLADWCNNLGLAYYHLHQYEEAIKLLEKSYMLNTRLGLSNATTYRNLALVYSNLKDLVSAEAYIRRALEGYARDSVTDSTSIFHSKTILALIQIEQGDIGNSVKLVNEVLAYGNRHEDSTFITDAISAQVTLYIYKGQYDVALEGLNKLLKYYKREQHHEKFSKALNSVGSLYYMNRNFSKAIEYFDSAASYNYNMFGDSAMIGLYVKNISHTYKVSGDSVMAKKYSDMYNSIKK